VGALPGAAASSRLHRRHCHRRCTPRRARPRLRSRPPQSRRLAIGSGSTTVPGFSLSAVHSVLTRNHLISTTPLPVATTASAHAAAVQLGRAFCARAKTTVTPLSPGTRANFVAFAAWRDVRLVKARKEERGAAHRGFPRGRSSLRFAGGFTAVGLACVVALMRASLVGW